jgi:hypothetical protein
MLGQLFGELDLEGVLIEADGLNIQRPLDVKATRPGSQLSC